MTEFADKQKYLMLFSSIFPLQISICLVFPSSVKDVKIKSGLQSPSISTKAEDEKGVILFERKGFEKS